MTTDNHIVFFPSPSQSIKDNKKAKCAHLIDKIINALEAADYDIRPLKKYVEDVDKCYEEATLEARKKGKESTLFHLNKYLDQQKLKKK